VNEYVFPIYNPTQYSGTITPYTTNVVMKYPKPGYDNPLVSAHVFDLDRYQSALGIPAASATLQLDWLGRHSKNDSIISEVAWVGNTTLIIKEVNRPADDGNIIVFDLDAAGGASRSMGRVVRKKGKNGEEGDDGWIDSVCIMYLLLLLLTCKWLNSRKLSTPFPQ